MLILFQKKPTTDISPKRSTSIPTAIISLVEEEVTLKRLYRDEENGRIILHPENKDMSDIVVDNCIIQGIAVKVIKDLN